MPVEEGGSRGYGVALLFLAPAAFFLIVWVVYPTSTRSAAASSA